MKDITSYNKLVIVTNNKISREILFSNISVNNIIIATTYSI